MERYSDCVRDHQEGIQSRRVVTELDAPDGVARDIDEFTETLLCEVRRQARVADQPPDPPASVDDVLRNWI